MTKIVSIGVILSLLLFIPACKGSPTTPQPPAVTVRSITVTSASTMLYIGAIETFTATATMSDSNIKAITSGTWTSDNTNVATVDSAGLVTIVGSGTANIVMTYSGKTGFKAIRGLPNYQGTWTGTYTIVSCSATADISHLWPVNDGYFSGGFCDYFIVGSVWPANLILMQEQDKVSGEFSLGSRGETLSARMVFGIYYNDLVALDGQSRLVGIDWGTIYSVYPFPAEVIWQLQSTTPGQISGGLTLRFFKDDYGGPGVDAEGLLTCTIALTRTSPMPN